jgi:hypothetical protein
MKVVHLLNSQAARDYDKYSGRSMNMAVIGGKSDVWHEQPELVFVVISTGIVGISTATIIRHEVFL